MIDKEFSEKIKNQRRRRLLSAIIIVVIFLLAAAALLSRYIGKGTGGSSEEAAVTLSITCSDLAEEPEKLNDAALKEYIPEDGWILEKRECTVVPGKTTVLDVLQDACRTEGIQIETESNPAYGSYVKGIGYLYEFSAGKYSGWMFSVNGEDSAYSADKVLLEGGEDILWYYVVDFDMQ